MTPKKGKPGSLVAPAAPAEAVEADNADPGESAQAKAQQAETQSGKYGSEKVKAFKPSDADPAKTAWIEIELVDEDNKPITGEPYKITLPDGQVYTGRLDHKGGARLEGIEPGTCKVTFPEIEGPSWKKA